jgi:hypothetical protein
MTHAVRRAHNVHIVYRTKQEFEGLRVGLGPYNHLRYSTKQEFEGLRVGLGPYNHLRYSTKQEFEGLRVGLGPYNHLRYSTNTVATIYIVRLPRVRFAPRGWSVNGVLSKL